MSNVWKGKKRCSNLIYNDKSFHKLSIESYNGCQGRILVEMVGEVEKYLGEVQKYLGEVQRSNLWPP